MGRIAKPLSILVIMDRQPLADRERTETLLRLVAGRTGSAWCGCCTNSNCARASVAMPRCSAICRAWVYRCRNDPDWTADFISGGSLALTGHAPDDFVTRRTINYGDLIHPDDRQMVWDEAQAAVGQRRPFTISYRIRAADGREKMGLGAGRRRVRRQR